MHCVSSLWSGDWTCCSRCKAYSSGTLLLGNDSAGSRVIPDLSVTNEPELTKDVEQLESSVPGLFTARAATRAAAR